MTEALKLVPLDFYKRCKTCGKEKSISEFPPKKSGKFGKAARCRTCDSKRQRDYRLDNLEDARRRSREERARTVTTDPRKFIWRAVKSNARARGLEFTLTPDDIIIPNVCPVIGIPIQIGAQFLGRNRRPRPNAPSVDRIDSSKGYIKGNIAVISWLANTIKNVGTAEQHEAIAKYMRANNVR